MTQVASDIGACCCPWVLRVVTVIGLGLAQLGCAIIDMTRGQRKDPLLYALVAPLFIHNFIFFLIIELLFQ
jgi:hypothetical protein